MKAIFSKRLSGFRIFVKQSVEFDRAKWPQDRAGRRRGRVVEEVPAAESAFGDGGAQGQRGRGTASAGDES